MKNQESRYSNFFNRITPKADIFVPINLAGLPAISVPVAQDYRGMPLGLQIIGPQYGDETIIQVAGAVERAIGEQDRSMRPN